MPASKADIHQHLLDLLDQSAEAARHSLDMARESRDNESKSTIGDKYETARAMAQIEIQKLEIQLGKTTQMRKELAQIDLSKAMERAAFGACVRTNEGTYYLSIGLGKVTLPGGGTFFAVSLASPIGRALLGATPGSAVSFQGRSIQVTGVE